MRREEIQDGLISSPAPSALIPLLNGGLEPYIWDAPEVIPGELNWNPMMTAYPVPPREILRSQMQGTMIAVQAVICTPAGKILPIQHGQHLMDMFAESAQRWLMAGVTKDSGGAALGDCRVIVHNTGQLGVNLQAQPDDEAPLPPNPGDPEVAETMSDGSGNYAVEVPQNTAYQLTAYKKGSPDVAGITRDDVVPVANG